MEQVTQADVKHVKTYLRKARELDTLVHTKLSESAYHLRNWAKE